MNLSAVATAYARMSHRPHHPLVRECYAALMVELWRQFLALPMRVRFCAFDPHGPISSAMFAEIERTNTLRVYALDGDMPSNHPLSTIAPNGHSYNAVFRAVHDGLAHYPGRYSFNPSGEMLAFRAHARTLSALATWALATETLGQNCWFNYGPYAHLLPCERPYAEQKAGLLPATLIAEHLEG